MRRCLAAFVAAVLLGVSLASLVPSDRRIYEADRAPVPVSAGALSTTAAPSQLLTYRLGPGVSHERSAEDADSTRRSSLWQRLR
jgi:hypothetical protein